MENGKKETITAFLSLFASFGTLICCALPALLVSLGLGAVMAGLASNFPGLIWISENKIPVFIVAAFLILLSGYFQFFVPQSCPTDPTKAKACILSKKISKWVFWASALIYLIGFYFAFLGKYFIGT